MKVVRPIEITEAVLTASSIPEPDVSVGEVEWQADIFSGYLFDNNVNPNQNAMAADINGDIIYVLENKESLSSPGAYVHKYNKSGGYIGYFTVHNSIYSMCVASDLNKIYGISTVGNVYEYDISSELETNTYGLAGSGYISGIAYDGDGFFVLDVNIAKIRRCTASFVYDSFEIQLDDATPALYSLRLINGDFSYFNQMTGKIRIIDQSSNYRGEIKPSQSYNSGFDIFGHFYIDQGLFIVNNKNSRAYKYTGGIYDGYYKVKDRVIKTSNHKLYECTIATADDPEVGVGKKPQTWVEVGPTNKWAVFDDKKSTKSKSNPPYAIQLVPGVTIDSLAGFAISGATDVTIVATSASAGEVFNETINLLNIDLAYDFYTWYTYEIDYIDEFVVTNIPPYPDLTIDISFTGAAIEVGNIVTGRGRNLGVLQTGVISDRVDYTRTTIDGFGEEATVIRPITKYSTYPIVIEKVQAPSVLRFLDGLRGLKCVWIGDIGNNQNLTTFGSIERSPLTYDTLSISEYQIKVRGSI